MRRGRISPELAAAFKPFATMRPEELSSLLSSIEGELAGVKLGAERKIDEKIRRGLAAGILDADEREELAAAAYGILYYRHSSSKKREDVLKEVLSAYTLSEDPELSAEQLATLEKNLTQLLDSPNLNASIKAAGLLDDEDKIFLGSRILTDIRPVFGDDLERSYMASLVIHTLRLTYRTNSRTETVYLAADKTDLEELKAQVERALGKARTTSRLLKASLPSFGDLIDRENE